MIENHNFSAKNMISLSARTIHGNWNHWVKDCWWAEYSHDCPVLPHRVLTNYKGERYFTVLKSSGKNPLTKWLNWMLPRMGQTDVPCLSLGLSGRYQHQLCGILCQNVEPELNPEKTVQLVGHSTRQLAWILFKR